MTRWPPRSLFGQTLLILLTGLVVSHAIGAWIYAGDREAAVRAIGGLAVAQRIANVTHLIEDAPDEWRERIVTASSDPTFRISLLSEPPASLNGIEADRISRTIADFLTGELGSDRKVRVAASQIEALPISMGAGHPMRMGAMMHAMGTWRDLQVAIALPTGEWLAFATALPETGPGTSWQFILSMLIMAVIVLAVAIWAVRRVTAPLTTLGAAAERLGRNLDAPPLEPIGTSEMRQAARAFNEMQDRLRRLIENRTLMLAAISHDLRTPLTLLRLRAENAAKDEDREKMVATIAQMDAMIDASLKFARSEATSEPRRPVDLAALLSSITDDMADAGRAVTMAPSRELVYECQPEALKRAVTNLLDNALKYGKHAHLSIETTHEAIAIVVEDEGPGIPQEELPRVVQPFYRLDESRSSKTGGIGLGLAIARSIAETHGGRLMLSNRPEGGLRASIALPSQSRAP